MSLNKKHLLQRGAGHELAIVAVVVIALVGVLGFLGFNAWQNSQAKQETKKSADASTGADPDAYLCKKNNTSSNQRSYNLVGKRKMYNSRQQAGPALLKVFAGKGYWCALIATSSTTHNVSKNMSIVLRSDWCPHTPSPLWGKIARDSGSYKYYAGPVYTPIRSHPRPNCMNNNDMNDWAAVSATMVYKGVTYKAGWGESPIWCDAKCWSA